MTQTQNKAVQIFDNLYRSLGGSGTNPDIAQFRKQLQGASDEQMIAAGSNHWPEIIKSLAQDSSPPTNVVEEVALFGEEMVTRLQRASTGTRAST